jgi:hypothetical protein
MCKHRFGVQLLQNPPFCSSTHRNHHQQHGCSNSFDISNSRVIINSKETRNSRGANNGGDVLSIYFRIIIKHGKSGTIVEYRVDDLKVEESSIMIHLCTNLFPVQPLENTSSA